MRWIYKIVAVACAVLGAVMGVWFYLDNMQTVTVIWFGRSVENVQLALWLLIFFAAGTTLGLSVSALQALRHQMHLQVLRRQLKAAKQKAAVRPV